MKYVQDNTPDELEQTIDWAIPQYVQNIDDPNFIVLTTGLFTPENFEGTALPCSFYPLGIYEDNFLKENFKLLEGTRTLIISNKKD